MNTMLMTVFERTQGNLRLACTRLATWADYSHGIVGVGSLGLLGGLAGVFIGAVGVRSCERRLPSRTSEPDLSVACWPFRWQSRSR
jgi:hypothetical protein